MSSPNRQRAVLVCAALALLAVAPSASPTVRYRVDPSLPYASIAIDAKGHCINSGGHLVPRAVGGELYAYVISPDAIVTVTALRDAEQRVEACLLQARLL